MPASQMISQTSLRFAIGPLKEIENNKTGVLPPECTIIYRESNFGAVYRASFFPSRKIVKRRIAASEIKIATSQSTPEQFNRI